MNNLNYRGSEREGNVISTESPSVISVISNRQPLSAPNSAGQEHYDVCIIGAGVTGAALARELSRYQLKVIILESSNDVAMGASKANSAIVHGGYAESHNKEKGRLCYRGRREFEHLDAELNFGFRPIGSLVLTTDESQLPALQALYANGLANSVPDLAILSHEKIAAIESALNPAVKYALHCSGAGVCSPYEYVIALIENAITNGVELRLQAAVTAITPTSEGFYVWINGNDTVVQTRYLVNAAGVAAQKVTALLDPSLPEKDEIAITPRTGEYLLMRHGSGSIINHVLFSMPTAMGKGILVTPTYYNNLLIGPDALNDSAASLDTHVDRLIKIFAAAAKTVNGLNINDFIRSYAGARAVASTDDFILKASSCYPRLVYAAGIQSPGLTASPAIAVRLVEILHEQGLHCLPKPDFNPFRQAILPERPENKAWLNGHELSAAVNLPLGDPERLVCRCEQVAEKTIDEAMRRPIPILSLDALKRRTRTGTGFCQGNFCGPRICQLLQEKYGRTIPPTTDVEAAGLRRVKKKDLLAAYKPDAPSKPDAANTSYTGSISAAPKN